MTIAASSLYIKPDEWDAVIKAHPHWFKPFNPKTRIIEAYSDGCQCKGCGHVFRHRDRKKFDGYPGFAPCEGRCPNCGSEFTFVNNSKVNVYPILLN